MGHAEGAAYHRVVVTRGRFGRCRRRVPGTCASQRARRWGRRA
ncbi:Hypothetical protein A7982_07351 [Minicystis rosea]|nr:Hypothetical protein A7982_07351 [Minicystis rosea]